MRVKRPRIGVRLGAGRFRIVCQREIALGQPEARVPVQEISGGTGDDIDRPQRLVDRARIFTHVLSDSDEEHCQLRICGSGEAS